MRVNILKEAGEHALSASVAKKIADTVSKSPEDVVTYDFGGVQAITFTFARILLSVQKKDVWVRGMEEAVSEKICKVGREKKTYIGMIF